MRSGASPITLLLCESMSILYEKDHGMTLRLWLAGLVFPSILLPNAMLAQSAGVKPAQAELGRGTHEDSRVLL